MAYMVWNHGGMLYIYLIGLWGQDAARPGKPSKKSSLYCLKGLVPYKGGTVTYHTGR